MEVQGRVGGQGALSPSLCLSAYLSVSLFFFLCPMSILSSLLLAVGVLASVDLCLLTCLSQNTRSLTSASQYICFFPSLSFSLFACVLAFSSLLRHGSLFVTLDFGACTN